MDYEKDALKQMVRICTIKRRKASSLLFPDVPDVYKPAVDNINKEDNHTGIRAVLSEQNAHTSKEYTSKEHAVAGNTDNDVRSKNVKRERLIKKALVLKKENEVRKVQKVYPDNGREESQKDPEVISIRKENTDAHKKNTDYNAKSEKSLIRMQHTEDNEKYDLSHTEKNDMSSVTRKLTGLVTDTAGKTVSPENYIKKYAKVKQFKRMITELKVDEAAVEGINGITNAVKKTMHIMFKPVKILLKQILFFAVMFIFIFILSCTVLVSACSIFSVVISDYDNYDNGQSQYVTSEKSDIAPGHLTDGYVYYNQGDYNEPMGVENGVVHTLSRSGCGLTALASVLATLTGDMTITPVTVLDYGLNGQSGYTAPIVLVSPALFGGLCTKYDLNYAYVDATYKNLDKALKKGHSLICMLDSTCYFTDGTIVTYNTHFVVLMAYDSSGNIACMNPNGGRLCHISPDTVVRAAGHFHEIWR